MQILIFLTDALKNSLEQLPAAVLLKQDKLKSGINIKSVNGQSLVGSGNLEVKGGGDVLQVTGTSTTAVMSQNAVTRIIGIYLVYWTLLTVKVV